jgi:hypothetical protein
MIGGLFSLSGFLSWKSAEEMHTCHVCTKCNGNISPDLISDIEDLGKINSGAVMFLMLIQELEKKGWTECNLNLQKPILTGVDAGLDPRLTPKFFKSPNKDSVLLKILPTKCLSACSEPQTIALVGNQQKFSYQFGRIQYEHLADMATMITDYCHSVDGYSSTRTRPTSLKGRVLARIPPIDGRSHQ